MRQISSTRFRRTYLAESEPVEVKAHDKTIGYWYPAGSELPKDETFTASQDPDEAPVRFTIRPALRARPDMVTETKPIFDPLELRKQEQVRSDEFTTRSFTPKRKTS